jgi:sulfite reductase (NADPH) hemoprotein beta-component/sulfite reductase (ferredoxin)
MRGIAEIQRRYRAAGRGPPSARTVLRWVRDEAVYEVGGRSARSTSAKASAQTIIDNVSARAPSCKLGITSSMASTRRSTSAWPGRTSPTSDAQDPHQEQVAPTAAPNTTSPTSAYGASIKVGEHTIPAYVAHVAGNFEGGEIILGSG